MLGFVLGKDPFLGIAVGDAFLVAEVVHQLLPFEAERGFAGVMAVVDACVDDLKRQSVSVVCIACALLTSELRLLVSVPTAPCFSIRSVDVPSLPAS